MKLYSIARKINHSLKSLKKANDRIYLSPVRHLESFSVGADQRLTAMTFDDGPTAAPPQPLSAPGFGDTPLTQVLMNILDEYGAKGTFDIIGCTEENYPDKTGKRNKPSWGGVKFDHYPAFGEDRLAGAKYNGNLLQMLLANDHQLTNHSYRHLLFGPKNVIYGNREHFETVWQVVDDLTRLHALVKTEHGYEMTMARPPHYVDKIPDKTTSYEAYALMGYDYMAAKFDGGGWLPTTGDFKADIRKMVEPLNQALQEDEAALNGKIIFQKDGYNMSMMTPVAYALRDHLELLKGRGYQVLTVAELKNRFPFADFHDSAKGFEIARALEQKGYVIAYRNNDFKADQTLTLGEMMTMTVTRSDYKETYLTALADPEQKALLQKHPYYPAYKKYGKLNEVGQWEQPATAKAVERFFYAELGLEIHVREKNLRRFEYLPYLEKLL